MTVSSTAPMNTETQPKYRKVAFGITRVALREGTGASAGNVYVMAEQPLAPYAERIADRLVHWASEVPDRIWMAKREKTLDAQGVAGTGDWQHISFAQALAGARSIGQALLNRSLGVNRPVAILSENDLEHALLSLGCIYAGVPYCSVSTAYSTVSTDHEKLRHVLGTLTPGLVFASDGARFAKAIAAAVGADVEVVTHSSSAAQTAAIAQTLGRPVTAFSDLLATVPTAAVDAAMRATGPDSIVKFLFTSGSTKLPKAVINTQRMWCSNQQQMLQSMPMLKDHQVLVDWLPWNHTFAGNHNFGLSLYHGGTIYIDDGKPMPGLINETLRNLREIAPTFYLNVPTGFEQIANAMQTDAVLRKTLLSKVQMFFYAGAALAQPIWDSLHQTQEAEIGERIVMGTGLGMTESAPFAIFVTSHNVKAGDLGVPCAGLELKLVPVDGKVEVRYKGPNITPGYWRNDEATQESFDEEGFFCSGDAVQWIDDNDIHQGLKFDGRIAEDFKLATGTFVSVGPMRGKIIAAGAPYVQDAVITGLNLKEVGALIFPTAAVRTLGGLPATSSFQDVLASPAVQAHFQTVLNQLASQSTGSATRVARLHVMHEPPSIDKGEVTDKGSINQRSVLKHRSALVDAFHEQAGADSSAIGPILKPQK